MGQYTKASSKKKNISISYPKIKTLKIILTKTMNIYIKKDQHFQKYF